MCVRARRFSRRFAIVLGSCLGPFADSIENPVSIDYAEIPNFLVSTAPSHAGKLIFGTVGGRRVVCMSGRFHYYEGYDFEQLTIPVRLFKLLGVKATILTNAAGAINTSYRPGDVMIVADTSNDRCKPASRRERFRIRPALFDTTRMYTPELREIARECVNLVSPFTRARPKIRMRRAPAGVSPFTRACTGRSARFNFTGTPPEQSIRPIARATWDDRGRPHQNDRCKPASRRERFEFGPFSIPRGCIRPSCAKSPVNARKIRGVHEGVYFYFTGPQF